MNRFRLVPPARLVLIIGSIAGLLAGMTTVALAGATLAEGDAPGSRSALEAIHLPPLLTLPGEEVTLSYEAFCVGDHGGAGSERQCEVGGSAFVRAGREQTFEEISLEASPTSPEGVKLEVRLPESIAGARDGLEYYAVLRNPASGSSVVVPSGGASAPHRSLRLADQVDVDLGRHVFRRDRAPDARVAAASWGSSATDVGLEAGRNLSPIGASAFDVDRSGAVYLLDEARQRILRWRSGGPTPKAIPVSVSGTLADMAVAPDGSIYVLETVGRPGGAPVVRRFDGDGRELERVEVAERSASQIRIGDNGPVVLQQPSHQWMPITVGGVVADAKTQRDNGRVERPLARGSEVIALRQGNEIRIALTGRNGARRSWRLHGEMLLGEVQLVEPLGNRLLVVTRAYTEAEAEFVVLVLDGRGLVSRFSTSADEWAEAAALGRFKLVGSSLYKLGSTARGAFVDRFDLEVRR